MTLTELKERIKEEVVLHEGDLKEWQWRRNGLLTEAEQDGITSAEFMRLVNDVSYQVGGLFPRINTLKATAEAYARADKKQLLPLHLDEIVTEAERLTLSRAFVTQRWLPAILATIPDPPKVETPAASVQPPVAVTPDPVVPVSLSREEVRRRIAARLDDYKSERTIPSWVLRDLLNALNADESVATEEIFSYLVSNFFKAAREPQGNTLRERLISADWENVLHKANPAPTPVVTSEPYRPEPSRIQEPQPVVRSFTATPARVRKGEAVTLSWEVDNLLAVTIDDLGAGLSPQNRGWVKPMKTTDYTLFDVNNNPLSTVRVEVIPPDRSGIYGVLFALALLALIYWFIKNTNAEKPEPPRKQGSEKTAEQSDNTPVRLTRKRAKKNVTSTETPVETMAKDEPVLTAGSKKEAAPEPRTAAPTIREPAESRSSSQTAKPQYSEPANKPYDKVDNRTDEQGWRMARKGKRWGYINEFDEWEIEPQFEAATPFRGNTASVFLNGQLMTINRSGEQVKN